MKAVYLDHAATTPMDPEVVDVISNTMRKFYGNPSSLHFLGREAQHQLSIARVQIAEFINAKPHEIIFTGSGTEADNIALFGIAHANKEKGKHIIVSAIEHDAVLSSAAQLEKDGFEVTYLPVDKDALVNVADLQKAIREDTILVSIMYANNEVGTIQPIKEIAQMIQALPKDSRPYFHTDACQAAPYIKLDVEELNLDLLTLSASKINGPKGIGLLYIRDGVKIEAHTFGGGQERGLRSGTENIPYVLGFAKAIELVGKRREKESLRELELRDHCFKRMKEAFPNVVINGHMTKRLPNNINVCFPNIEGESIGLLLDQKGICVSTGSACATTDLFPSHVLQALGVSDEIIHGSMRISTGLGTTKEDIDQTIDALIEIVHYLEGTTALTTQAYEQRKR